MLAENHRLFLLVRKARADAYRGERARLRGCAAHLRGQQGSGKRRHGYEFWANSCTAIEDPWIRSMIKSISFGNGNNF